MSHVVQKAVAYPGFNTMESDFKKRKTNQKECADWRIFLQSQVKLKTNAQDKNYDQRSQFSKKRVQKDTNWGGLGKFVRREILS